MVEKQTKGVQLAAWHNNKENQISSLFQWVLIFLATHFSTHHFSIFIAIITCAFFYLPGHCLNSCDEFFCSSSLSVIGCCHPFFQCKILKTFRCSLSAFHASSNKNWRFNVHACNTSRDCDWNEQCQIWDHSGSAMHLIPSDPPLASCLFVHRWQFPPHCALTSTIFTA